MAMDRIVRVGGAEFGLPLTRFMEEYWEERMHDFLRDREGAEFKRERREMRELGVVVKELDEFEESDSDDDNVNDDGDGDDEEYLGSEDEGIHADNDSESEDSHDCENTTASV